MDANKEKKVLKQQNESFIDMNDEEIQDLLDNSKSKDTNKSRNTAVNRFKAFLALRNYPDVEQLSDEDLPKILTKFYTDVRTMTSGENDKTSSFKVIRAGLNRYFKFNCSLDIVSDERFTRANLVFDGVQVRAKCSGKGTIKSTQHIADKDMVKIARYFSMDHVTKPEQKILQQTVLFYIMYFFCCRGQENLCDMTKEHFEVVVDPSRVRYVVQNIDELDKNHGVNDTTIANAGKMYEDPGTSKFQLSCNHTPKQIAMPKLLTFLIFLNNVTY